MVRSPNEETLDMCIQKPGSIPPIKAADLNYPGKSSLFPRPLIVLMFAYFILTLAYATLTPPWETPDEPAHYRYVMQLAERWRPPPDPTVRQRDRFCRDYSYITSNYEWYHPALGYLPLAAVYRFLHIAAPHSLPMTIPPFNPLFCSDPFTNPNLFHLETPYPLRIWQHQWGLLILRISSSLWGLVVIFVTYRIGQLLRIEELAIAASSWVAFLPQFVFISASVRNDTLNNAVSALLFLLATNILLFPKSESHKNLIWTTGLVLGAGILTKITVIYLIPVVLLAIFLSRSNLSQRERIGSAVWVTMLSLMIVALYYLGYPEARAALLYTGMQMKINPSSLSWAYWKPFLPMLLELFFARFGWANILIPKWWTISAFGIWILGMSLSVYHMIRLLKHDRTNPVLHLMFLFSLGSVIAFVGVVRYNFSHFQPQGRFLFPALVGLALLGTWGIMMSLPRQARYPVALAMAGFMLTFNLRALAGLISAYYY